MTTSTFPIITPAAKQAIEDGDVKGLERMLKAGLSPNMVETQEEGETKSQHSALILAISLNQVEVADLLVRAGADVDTIFLNYDNVNKCMYELSALATTRMLYEFTLTTCLGALLSTLEEGVQKNQGREPRKIMPIDLPKDVPNEVLTDSVREGDLDSVTLLVSHGMDVNLVHTDCESGHLMSLLILAILKDHCSVAVFLLEKGADCGIIYLNYDKDEDNVIEVTALTAAKQRQEKAPSREMSGVIQIINDELEKLTEEPKIIPAKDIPKNKLDLLRYRKKVPRIFIASVNEEEVEEIMAWESGSAASFSNGRGILYKETAMDVDDADTNNSEQPLNDSANGPHISEKRAIMTQNEEEEAKKKSAACVLL